MQRIKEKRKNDFTNVGTYTNIIRYEFTYFPSGILKIKKIYVCVGTGKNGYD